MSSCRSRSSFVSILNNDDNPAFAVRSAHGTPNTQYQLPQPSSNPYYGRTYSDSPSPRVMRQPFIDHAPDSHRPAPAPASPGSSLSDCSSFDTYSAPATAPYYHPYARHTHTHTHAHDPYAYHARPEKRLNNNSMTHTNEPPSPQPSIASTSKESVTQKPARKNKYPCPFAASHACTATFTTSGHAARHGKKHTGEKSVHCPICNKAFTRKDNMKQHIRTHRGHSEDNMSVSAGSTPRREDAEREWAVRNKRLYDH